MTLKLFELGPGAKVGKVTARCCVSTKDGNSEIICTEQDCDGRIVDGKLVCKRRPIQPES